MAAPVAAISLVSAFIDHLFQFLELRLLKPGANVAGESFESELDESYPCCSKT
jgi:hypothetical protein